MSVPTQEQLKRMHCGLIGATIIDAWIHMKEIIPILMTAPMGYNKLSDYIIDAKVHMLMPNQWPCIPNWHYDHTPRDSQGNKLWNKRDPNQNMYLWISGPPFTMFRDGREVKAGEWVKFNQFDKHRGTMSKEHQWRLFIRLTPKEIYPSTNNHSCLRRHSQVYLDVNGFTW